MGRDDEDRSGDPGFTWDDSSGSRPASRSVAWDDILEQPSAVDDGTPHAFQTPDEARYKRLGLLGKGGMGQVLMTFDQRLRREVALKEVINKSATGELSNARLAREAWITAQLEHPGIVPVYDSGCSDTGDLFYTMRLIRGRSLGETLTEASSLPERLGQIRRFLHACQAVSYAHSLGIVHRDLKPSNIMIGEFGETQVVDWGLARPSNNALGKRWREQVLPEPDLTQTIEGKIIGTPAYMSPEQASGELATVQCDVWGLGAILYMLLTGHPPFTGTNTKSVLQQVLTRSPESVLSAEPDAPTELIAIAERALCRDLTVRYPNAGALAADLILYLDGRHVSAYHYTSLDHLRRLVAAWRVPLAVAGVSLAVIVLLSIFSTIQIRADRDRARLAESEAKAARHLADTNLAQSLVQQADIAVNTYSRAEAEVLAAHALTLRESPQARGVLATFGNTPHPTLVNTEPLPDCIQRILSQDAQSLLCLTGEDTSLWDLAPLTLRWSKRLDARSAYFSQAGDEVVLFSQGWDNMVFLNASDGGLSSEVTGVAELLYRKHHGFLGFTFSSTGQSVLNTPLRIAYSVADRTASLLPFCVESVQLPIIAALSGERFVATCGDGTIEEGTLDGPRLTSRLDLEADEYLAIAKILLSDDERWMVLGSLRGGVYLVDMETHKIVRRDMTNMGSTLDLTMSPDNRYLAISGERGGVRIWHVPTGTWIGQIPTKKVRNIEFGEGNVLTVLGETLQQWKLPAGLLPRSFQADGGFTSASFSSDGAFLAGSTGNGAVQVWSLSHDAESPHGGSAWVESVTLPPQRAGVGKDCSFGPDGDVLLSVGHNSQGILVYSTSDWSLLEPLIPQDLGKGNTSLRRVGALQDGLFFGLSYGTSGPEVWSVEDGAFLDGLRMPGRIFGEAELNHTGSAAMFIDNKDQVYVLFAGEAPELVPVVVTESPAAGDISSSGEHVAVASTRRISLYATATGKETLRIEDVKNHIIDVAFSADGRYIAAGEIGGVTQVWSAETGVLLAVMHGHTERVAAVEFSPDGRWLATGSWDGSLQLWGLEVLEKPASTLVEELEATWQMTLEDALSLRIR